MAGLPGWRPIRDTHAIQSATVSVAFNQPVGNVLLRRMDAQLAAEAQRLGLLDREGIAAFQIPLPLQNILQMPNSQGASYSMRESPEFYSERVQLTADVVRYEQWSYTRWAPFLERARSLMQPSVDEYAKVSSLSEISATYVDVFEAIAENEKPDISVIVPKDASAIAAGAFRKTGQWHTHSGWFDYLADGFSRRLSTVNVDVLDRPTTDDSGFLRTVQITTRVADAFQLPAYLGANVVPDEAVSWNFVEDRLQSLHVDLKNLLRGALTQEALAAISLG